MVTSNLGLLMCGQGRKNSIIVETSLNSLVNPLTTSPFGTVALEIANPSCNYFVDAPLSDQLTCMVSEKDVEDLPGRPNLHSMIAVSAEIKTVGPVRVHHHLSVGETHPVTKSIAAEDIVVDLLPQIYVGDGNLVPAVNRPQRGLVVPALLAVEVLELRKGGRE